MCGWPGSDIVPRMPENNSLAASVFILVQELGRWCTFVWYDCEIKCQIPYVKQIIACSALFHKQFKSPRMHGEKTLFTN